MVKLILVILLFIPVLAMAEGASPVPVPVPVPEPFLGWPWLDQIMQFIEGIPAAVIPIILGVIEFVLRLIPSQKPLGIMQGGSKVLDQFGRLFAVLGSFLDKILPQKLK